MEKGYWIPFSQGKPDLLLKYANFKKHIYVPDMLTELILHLRHHDVLAAQPEGFGIFKFLKQPFLFLYDDWLLRYTQTLHILRQNQAPSKEAPE